MSCSLSDVPASDVAQVYGIPAMMDAARTGPIRGNFCSPSNVA